MARPVLLLTLLLCLHARAVALEVYRSVDANGVPGFSDRPPAGQASEPFDLDAPAPPADPETAARREEIRRSADTLHANRTREYPEPAPPAAPAPPSPPATVRPDGQDSWWPIYSPGFAGVHRPRPQPVPPLAAPPVPRPNPDSASPQGLRERIRRSW